MTPAQILAVIDPEAAASARTGRYLGRDIVRLVARRQDVPVDQLTGGSQVRAIAWPRQRAMWLVRAFRPDLSSPYIGRLFGGRDHTTVLYAWRQVEARMDADPAEEAIIADLIAAVREDLRPAQIELDPLDRKILRATALLNRLKARRLWKPTHERRFAALDRSATP